MTAVKTSWLKTVIYGYIIGVANIIPGVSGGTLALVLGIYKRLITAIHNMDLQLIRTCFRVLAFRPGAIGELREELRRVDAAFLGVLLLGILIALGSMSHLMDYLLANHHEPTYGFFFGLIIVSIIVPYRHLKRRSWKELLSATLAIALTVGLACSVSDDQKIKKAQAREETAAEVMGNTTEDPGFVSLELPTAGEAALIFASAVLAISCMILPGISGSFVLLLIGVYFRFLQAINDREIFILAIFALGCLVGLLVFVRFMNWLLEKFYNPTLAFMVGLMIGSLYAIWPIKAFEVVGSEKIYLGNIMPEAWGATELVTVAAMAAGALLVGAFCFIDARRTDSTEMV